MRLIVAEVLHVPPDRVAVAKPTPTSPLRLRHLRQPGHLCLWRLCPCRRPLLKEQLLQMAAELLEVPAASLVADDGRVYPAADPPAA